MQGLEILQEGENFSLNTNFAPYISSNKIAIFVSKNVYMSFQAMRTRPTIRII